MVAHLAHAEQQLQDEAVDLLAGVVDAVSAEEAGGLLGEELVFRLLLGREGDGVDVLGQTGQAQVDEGHCLCAAEAERGDECLEALLVAGEVALHGAGDDAVVDAEVGEAAGVAQEADEGVEVLEVVDDRGASEAPAAFGVKGGDGETRLGFRVSYVVGFVEDDASPH